MSEARKDMLQGTTEGQVWRHYIALYCDLVSLIRLSGVNRFLYHMLNEPRFIVEWQSSCWYLFRDCLCERNQFYLNIEEWCEYLWDTSGSWTAMGFGDRVLTDFGRDVWRLLLRPTSSMLKDTPTLDAMNGLFHSGVFQSFTEQLIVPMPRMVYVPVECTTLLPSVYTRQDNETLDEAKHRSFWRNFHEVAPGLPVPDAGFGWTDYHRASQYRDPLDVYLERCAREGLNPHDPGHDPDCEGHHTAQVLRQSMYSTPLGQQLYPLDLCLRREDLGGMARYRGVDYIDRIHLPSHEFGGSERLLLDHRGPVYLDGARYTHERGDLVPWALSTLNVQNAFYRHLWFDCMHHLLHGVQAHVHMMIGIIEADLSAELAANRYRWVDHQTICTGCRSQPYHMHPPEERERDAEAIRFVNHPFYEAFHGLLRTSIEQAVTLGPWAEHHYLGALYPTMAADYREETLMVRDVHYLLELLGFVTDFSLYMAPRVNPEEAVARKRTVATYIASGISLFAFAPTWKMGYHWAPSKANEMISLKTPYVVATQNHRFQRYCQFLNERTLFYQPEALSILRQAQHGKDAGRYFSSN